MTVWGWKGWMDGSVLYDGQATVGREELTGAEMPQLAEQRAAPGLRQLSLKTARKRGRVLNCAGLQSFEDLSPND